MNKQQEENSFFSAFLREDAPELTEVLFHEATGEAELDFREGKVELPQMPSSDQAPEAELRSYWRELRAFFRSGKDGGISPEFLGFPLYPALFSAYHGQEYAQSEYPFWLAGEGILQAPLASGSNGTSWREIFEEAVVALSLAGGDNEALTRHRGRLEKILREELLSGSRVRSLQEILPAVWEKLQSQLALSGVEGEILDRLLDQLNKQLPKQGMLVPYSQQAHWWILASAIRTCRAQQWQALEEQLSPLIHRLTELLAVEKAKSPEANDAAHLHGAMDFADTYINFEELSAVLPIEGGVPMPGDRYRRLEKVLASLKGLRVNLFERELLLIVPKFDHDLNAKVWELVFPGARIEAAKTGALCRTAIRQFDLQMADLTEGFAAMRIAELELKEQYVPEIHEAHFAHFDWQFLNPTELAVCPPVVLVAGVDTLLRSELNDFSYLLSTGRNIRTMAIKSDARTRFDTQAEEERGMQQELSSFAISHRNAYVLQSSLVSPGHLHQGIFESLSLPLPAVWCVLSYTENPMLAVDDYLWTSAAVESRDFPTLVYNGGKGPKWGSRFDISSNPQAEADWSEHELKIFEADGQEAKLQIAFTFADFAAQDPAFWDQFRLVPPDYWTEELLPLSQYLTLSASEAYGKVPFIWMIDPEQQLKKVVVAWSIVHACRERLDFWHYVQENAGVNSYHVQLAEARLRNELEAATEQEIKALKEQFEAEKAQAVEAAASEAMERLAASLLDMDVVSGITSSVLNPAPVKKSPTESQKANPVPETKAKTPPVGPEEEDELLNAEAYIDTPLCTTCNECINLNPRIFHYNADKQAYVADPGAGPFADIVKAAELCPAAIIQPGSPLNPKEAGLADLILRAQPFNT